MIEYELKEKIKDVIRDRQLPEIDISFRSIPFHGTWGLAASFLFALLSKIKEHEPSIDRDRLSNELLDEIKTKTSTIAGIERVELEKGYVNFYFKPNIVAKGVIAEILSKRENFGRGEPKSIKVMVEYSQPNTHKDIHIGHLRNICLGISLVSILRFAGYETLAANYIGDIGTHVIKCLWGYNRFYKGMEPPSGRGRWLGDVYAFAESKHSASEKMREEVTDWLREFFQKPSNAAINIISKRILEYMREENILLTPNLDKKTYSQNMVKTIARIRHELHELLQNGIVSATHVADIREKLKHFDESGPIWGYVDEVLEVWSHWEASDPELIELWKKTRDWSLTHFESVYRELGAKFDHVFYESEEEGPGKELVKKLVEQGIAKIDEGAAVVKIDEKLGLEKETYKTFIILRSDGTSLYATKDLALAIKKFREFGIDRSIYLVDVGQSFYFKQLFKTLELIGFEQAKNCVHLAYGRVSLPEGKMSSRLGNIIYYTDLRNELCLRARKIVQLKQPEAGEETWRTISKIVAMGAMKYNMVKIDSDKEMVFDWDEALDYNGRTAPYIQYAHARASKILEKGGKYNPDLICQKELNEPEIELVKKIAEFPSIVQRCADEAKPLPLATYVFELAQLFSDFYHRCPVIQESDESIQATRMALVESARIVLAKGLSLMGIEAPDNM